MLTANLTGRHDSALKAQVEASEQCPGWTDITHGDCERDYALYSIRHRKFIKTRQHIETARKLHTDDVDRSALLDMVEASGGIH